MREMWLEKETARRRRAIFFGERAGVGCSVFRNWREVSIICNPRLLPANSEKPNTRPLTVDTASLQSAPKGSGRKRVLRGASFNNQPSNVRSSNRNNNAPTNRNNNFGFRVARTLWPSSRTVVPESDRSRTFGACQVHSPGHTRRRRSNVDESLRDSNSGRGVTGLRGASAKATQGLAGLVGPPGLERSAKPAGFADAVFSVAFNQPPIIRPISSKLWQANPKLFVFQHCRS